MRAASGSMPVRREAGRTGLRSGCHQGRPFNSRYRLRGSECAAHVAGQYRRAAVSYDLILPYFPKEIQALLLDPTISDLMVNGTRGSVCRPCRQGREDRTVRPLHQRTSYRCNRESGASAWTGSDEPEPHPQHTAARWFARRGGRPASVEGWAVAHHPQVQPVVHQRSACGIRQSAGEGS